jgi:tyrosyl-tRNA synthetase
MCSRWAIFLGSFQGRQQSIKAKPEQQTTLKQTLTEPDDITEIELTASGEGYAIALLLKDAGLTVSTSDSNRMVKQGAVKYDGEKITDAKLVVPVGAEHVFQVGKRKFAKVKIKP